MIHSDITKLVPALQNRAMNAIEEMRGDAQLKALGVTGIVIVETLRDLPVQMAYRSRLLWTEIRESGELDDVATNGIIKATIVKYVQAMYRAAGLYQISAEEAVSPVTWTLESKHLKGEAIDIAPELLGKIWWGAPSEVWKRIGAIGMEHGLKWGGNWKKPDCPHFEI